MFSEFWKGLGGSFDKRWLLHAFAPALLFWGASLWIWMQIQGVSSSLELWQAYSTETQFFYTIAGFLVVVLTGILLESFENGILSFYEGYWPWSQKLADHRAKDLREKRTQHERLRLKLVRDEIGPKERVELGRLNANLPHRPENPERSMPTHLGDILRTAEDYPRKHYGLDPRTLWPRLYPQLSESLRKALGATRDQLNLALRLATLALLYGVIWSLVAAYLHKWLVLTWTVPALLLAWLLWRSAHPAAISYAGLFRSAFDLHRFDVYEALHWPKPSSPAKEITHGQQLILFLSDHIIPDDLDYLDAEEDEGEDEDDKSSHRSFWKRLFGFGYNK